LPTREERKSKGLQTSSWMNLREDKAGDWIGRRENSRLWADGDRRIKSKTQNECIFSNVPDPRWMKYGRSSGNEHALEGPLSMHHPRQSVMCFVIPCTISVSGSIPRARQVYSISWWSSEEASNSIMCLLEESIRSRTRVLNKAPFLV
jgi:hypothetical protein